MPVLIICNKLMTTVVKQIIMEQNQRVQDYKNTFRKLYIVFGTESSPVDHNLNLNLLEIYSIIHIIPATMRFVGVIQRLHYLFYFYHKLNNPFEVG